MRSPRLFVHETRLSAVFKAHPSLLSGSFLVEPDVSPHLNPNRTGLCQSAAKCDKHCELFGQRFFFIRHESESHRESHSICTRDHCN